MIHKCIYYVDIKQPRESGIVLHTIVSFLFFIFSSCVSNLHMFPSLLTVVFFLIGNSSVEYDSTISLNFVSFTPVADTLCSFLIKQFSPDGNL